ncbi:unnamed protein product, partial [Prorocentrum cordatum]
MGSDEHRSKFSQRSLAATEGNFEDATKQTDTAMEGLTAQRQVLQTSLVRIKAESSGDNCKMQATESTVEMEARPNKHDISIGKVINVQ